MTTKTEEMNELHILLAKTLKNEIDSAVKADDKKGISALLNVARQFLKDNGIESKLLPESPLNDLTASLPFPDGSVAESDSSVKH